MDNKIIKALENAKHISDQDKKAYYSLYQNTSPKLKEILLKVINARSKKELLEARTELAEYLNKQKEEIDIRMKKGITNIYKESEKESEKLEQDKEADLLEQL